MASSEELVIRVTTDVNAKTKEQVEQTKQAFRFMGGAENQGHFEKIFKHTGNLERQIKSLAESIGRGAPIQGMTNFISNFGRAGAVIGGISVAAGLVINHINKVANKTMDLARAARRAMVHPAQLQEMREVAERGGVSAESMDSMAQSFAEMIGNLKTGLPEYREQFFRNLTNPQDREKMRATLEQIIASEKPIGMNLAKEFAEGIRRHYTSVGNPEEGARIAEQWLQVWFGSIDMDRIKEEFKTVSEDAKKAMDSLVEASEQWVVLTNTIIQNFNRIINMVTLDVMNDPLLGPILRGIAKLSQAAAGAAESAYAQGERPWWLPYPSDVLRGIHPSTIPAEILSRYLRGNTKLPGAPTIELPEVEVNENRLQDPTRPQFLMELEKQVDHIAELVEQFQRFNALLTGQELSVGDLSAITRGALTNVQGNPAFHNSPLGGAKGESNPIQLPPDEPQPGGGAAAEARDSPGFRGGREAAKEADSKLRSGIAGSVDQAMKLVGLNEKKDQDVLREYMRTGGRGLTSDQNAWCARFVNAINVNAGLPSLESQVGAERAWSSRAFERWGEKVDLSKGDTIQPGDVLIKARGNDPNKGHVGVATGNYRLNEKTGEYEYEMLSGNIGGEQVIPGTNKPAQGGGVGLTYETIGGKAGGESAPGAGKGGVLAVRRGQRAADAVQMVDTGPEEGAGKGLRLDPTSTAIAASGERGLDAQLGMPGASESRSDSDMSAVALMGNNNYSDMLKRSGDMVGRSGGFDESDDPIGMRKTMDRDLGAGFGGDESPSVRSRLDVNVKAPAGTEVRTTADGDDNMFKGNVSTERQIPLQ